MIASHRELGYFSAFLALPPLRQLDVDGYDRTKLEAAGHAIVSPLVIKSVAF